MFKRISLLLISAAIISSLPMAHGANVAETASAAPSSDLQLAAAASALVRQQCERDEYSGAALIAREGRIVFESACGEASKRYHVPNNIETKFNIASLGKMFTAVAIAQLVESGRVSWDDKISKFVDASWLPASVTNRITIAQLLNHSSGLPEFLIREDVRNRSRALYRELADMRPLIQGIEPSFQPGSRYSYNNTGYLLLGVVIEQVSGENYFDYIRKHIYQPAGMNQSDSYALDEPVENLATGYMTNAPKRKESTFAGLLRGSAFGCGYSTVHDLLRFSRALKNGSLIRQETLQTLWQNHAPEVTQKGGGYGYGFELRPGTAGQIVGHSGQFPGVLARFDMHPDKDQVVILLSNYDSWFLLADKIEELLTQTRQTQQ